jgi:hypothetical protein
MVVDMGFLGVVALLVLLAVVVAVGKFVVVVFVGVPIDPVFDLTRISDVVGDVPVIVGMSDGWVRMFRLPAFTFGVLLLRHA